MTEFEYTEEKKMPIISLQAPLRDGQFDILSFRKEFSTLPDLEELNDIVTFQNLVVGMSPSDKRGLWQKVIRRQCEVCGQIPNVEWTLKHLCVDGCVDDTQMSGNKVNAHECSERCMPLMLCKPSLENVYFCCAQCVIRLEEDYYLSSSGRFRLFLASGGSGGSGSLLGCKYQLYANICKQGYLIQSTRLQGMSIFQVLEDIWLRWFQQNFVCWRCEQWVEKPYVRYGSLVMCFHCKDMFKCRECGVESDDHRVTYDGSNGQYRICDECYFGLCLTVSEVTDENVEEDRSMTFPTSDFEFRSVLFKDLKALHHFDLETFPDEAYELATIQDVMCLFRLQGARCAICFNVLTYPVGSRCVKVSTDCSINRLNNSLPHCVNNLNITCWGCNRAYRTCVVCGYASLLKSNFSVKNNRTICHDCGFQSERLRFGATTKTVIKS